MINPSNDSFYALKGASIRDDESATTRPSTAMSAFMHSTSIFSESKQTKLSVNDLLFVKSPNKIPQIQEASTASIK